MARFSFTFSRVSEESAEYGEAAAHGWVLPGGWEFPLQDEEGHHDKVLDEAQAGEFDIASLSEAVSFAQTLGIYADEYGGFSTVDPETDMQTGDDTSYAMHVDGVTGATLERIRRLLTWS